MTVRTTHSKIDQLSVAIGFSEFIDVDVPHASIDIGDLSPVGSVPMTGIADVRVRVKGPFKNPHLEGDIAGIQNFSISDLAFGNVTQGHVSLTDTRYLDLRDVHAVKGKSSFDISTGRLDFGGQANMQMDAQIASNSLDVRDFFNVFKLDEDPRFKEVEGTLETKTRLHLAVGGPEDVCSGGYLDVQASVDAQKLNLLGERFDRGHADFEYRWLDQQAGVDGAEVEVRSLSLTKVDKPGRAPLGSVLGSLSVRRGGDLRGNLVFQGFPLGRTNLLGTFAANVEGSASGVARLSGSISALEVDVGANFTPVRIFGAPFGGSDLHLSMVQFPTKSKVIGKTKCGASIPAPFDKDEWLHDTSVQGAYTTSGVLFGGQVKLDNVVLTKQKFPVLTGRFDFDHFDLAPLGKAMPSSPAHDAAASVDSVVPITGELSGALVVERLAAGDVPHAKAQFTPRAFRLSRGGQGLALRTAASRAGTVEPAVVIALSNDDVTIPKVVFDLTAPNGFSGAFALNGAVKKVTRGADLFLDADLSPIDMGIIVGVVPRVTRARGTLTGAVKLRGKGTQPEFDGQLAIRRGEFGIKDFAGGITDVDVDLVVDENEARITRATGHFLGGDLGLTGRMKLTGGQLGVAEAVVTGRQLAVAPQDGIRATVDADLQVSLNPVAESVQGRLPYVTGTVTLTSFDYTHPTAFDLLDLNGIGAAKRTVIDSYDPSLDSVLFGVDVHSRVPLRLRNNLIEAQLGIDSRGLRVTGTNQRMGLRGEVNSLAGGHVRVFANDFEVQKGTIRFDDPTRIAPHVDITATTEYRRYNALATGASSGTGVSSGSRGGGLWRITLHVYGDADDVHVDISSDPALSREDIFFLLTIGLTRAELDQVRAGSVYASAAFEALGTVSGVDRAVKQAIPVIDDFRPGTAYSPRTGRVEPNITVGRRLSENVRARVTSGLAEDPQLRSTIEWRLGRTFTVEPSYDRSTTVSSSNVGNFGLDFRWRLEFN
jgi:translocation and assembly module TamB